MTITLITGGNKGLGREAARRLIGLGHTVYLGARDAGRGQAAAGHGPGWITARGESAGRASALVTVPGHEARCDNSKRRERARRGGCPAQREAPEGAHIG